MLRPIIYPYKLQSESAKALSKSLSDLRCKRVRENGNYSYYNNHIIINWGNPRLPNWINDDVVILNNPSVVQTTQNKHSALEVMLGKVRIPKFTTLMESAKRWIKEDRVAVARTLLRGCGGRGINLVNDADDLPDCALYTRYVKKSDEYRVHIFMGTIIFLQKKMLRKGSEGNNFQIRNHANGWIFGSKGIAVPQDVVEQALLAVKALKLDFGAVDVGWQESSQKAFVYEVNTAPALEGTTLNLYSQHIRRLLV
jgi:glutathione synthase/RimK-type ligase-like ATP-grasp enzyme|tara:strand:+ start:421 stop:1182 length:762 start_codon:yes stop_codon:yes gene_type:complete